LLLLLTGGEAESRRARAGTAAVEFRLAAVFDDKLGPYGNNRLGHKQNFVSMPEHIQVTKKIEALNRTVNIVVPQKWG
jgi:hypothetical protein